MCSQSCLIYAFCHHFVVWNMRVILGCDISKVDYIENFRYEERNRWTVIHWDKMKFILMNDRMYCKLQQVTTNSMPWEPRFRIQNESLPFATKEDYLRHLNPKEWQKMPINIVFLKKKIPRCCPISSRGNHHDSLYCSNAFLLVQRKRPGNMLTNSKLFSSEVMICSKMICPNGDTIWCPVCVIISRECAAHHTSGQWPWLMTGFQWRSQSYLVAKTHWRPVGVTHHIG